MIFAAKGASDGIYLAFDKNDTDIISLAQIHRNRGLKRRGKEGEGSYSVLVDVVASTSTSEENITAATTGNGFATTMCFTFIVEDDMMCALGKQNPAGSFDDCPSIPVAADFMAEDGASLDLDALNAEVAQAFRRPSAADVQWPADLPGLWKGTEFYAQDNGVVTEGPIYTVITEGYAPNPWIFLDAENSSKIVSANVGKFSGAERLPNGANVYRNAVFKYMPGTDAEHRAGRERWCNSYVVVDDDEMFMLSNSAAEGSEEEKEAPECPEAPDPKRFSPYDAVEKKAFGANAAGVLTRQYE